MSVSYIPAALRRLVEERANHRCEYRLVFVQAGSPNNLDNE